MEQTATTTTRDDHSGTGARRWIRGILGSALAGVVGLATVVVAANTIVVSRTDNDLTTDAGALDPAQAAIVPGSHVRDDGSLGTVVAERVAAAVTLYRAGTVETVLVSGDHGTTTYNETDAMRDAVLAAGIPARDVFTDYAGFSTWDTMSRAREIFGVETAVVVTQSVYAARSVDLGHAAGIDTQGYVVREGGRRGREVLARVRGLGEATWRPDVVGGDTIPITGDGRASWGRSDTRPPGWASATQWAPTPAGAGSRPSSCDDGHDLGRSSEAATDDTIGFLRRQGA